MHKEVIGKSRFSATMRILRRLIRPDSNVVEIGSNDASFRDSFIVAKWTTVDKFGVPDVQVDINVPEVRLPFADGACDVVICTEVLEHLTLGTPFTREMARVLKPGGTAVISVPNIASLKSRLKVVFGGLPNMAASGDCGHPLGGTGMLSESGHWVGGHVVDFNLARLKGYLERSGFTSFRWHKVPVSLPISSRSIAIPSWLLLPTFPDFLLVEAGSTRVPLASNLGGGANEALRRGASRQKEAD
ncbi:methyltransferase domain-containing protein [Luteimonas sp. A534]